MAISLHLKIHDGMTNRDGVFAGGDVVHKPATVVLSYARAKKAVDRHG